MEETFYTSPMKRLANWLGNEPLSSSSDTYFVHANPATEEAIFEVPESDIMALVKALQTAHQAAAVWTKTEVDKRRELLHLTAGKLREQLEDLARLEAMETGAPLKVARADVEEAISFFEYYSRFSFREDLVLHPVGVVGIITPFCQPIGILAQKLAPALLTGNTVIAKPSEFASGVASKFAEVFYSAGWPSGVVNFIFGRTAGELLLQHPGISTVSFTGKTETGQKFAMLAAEHLKSLQLSLSAQNPVLVFADADLTWLKSICFQTHGRSCLRGSRLFVQETIYPQFLEVLRGIFSTVKIGNPLSEDTDLGPLPTREHVQMYEKACIQAASEKGKPFQWTGELPEKGFFVKPTASVDLTLCSTLQQEEVIGPFITVASFKYQHEAIKKANTSPFGRAAYVLTASLEKASKVAPQLEASSVFVNSPGRIDPSRSTLAIKKSGHGAEDGEASLNFFSRASRLFV